MWIITDLDGTLCNIENRVNYALIRDWDRFHEGISQDPICRPVQEVIQTMGQLHNVAIMTGRPERYAFQTITWLNAHGIPWKKLLMRGDKDYRADFELKLDLAKENGMWPDDVLFIMEDRARITRMWRKAGYTCFQVAKGLY